MLCANIGSSEDALCSARSTDAIRLSIRVPVNIIFNVPVFLPGRGLVLFFLAAPRKLHHRVSSNLYPARLTSTAPGARQFLRGKLNSGKLNSYELKLFQRPASSRFATAECDQSRPLMPSPASS